MLILNGGIGRIRVYGVDEYDHADVKLDKMGNISCSMVKSVPLQETDGADDGEEKGLHRIHHLQLSPAGDGKPLCLLYYSVCTWKNTFESSAKYHIRGRNTCKKRL